MTLPNVIERGAGSLAKAFERFGTWWAESLNILLKDWYDFIDYLLSTSYAAVDDLLQRMSKGSE